MGKNAVVNEYFTRYSFHHAVHSAMHAANKHTHVVRMFVIIKTLIC